jgi:hypothetical protein
VSVTLAKGVGFIVNGLLLALVGTSSARAASACDSILSSALLSHSTKQESQAADSARRQFVCASASSDLRNFWSSATSESQSGSGGFSIYGWGIGAGGSSASSASSANDQISAWKQANCAMHNAGDSNSAFEFLSEQALAPEVVHAWRDCMLKQDGLTCFAKPSGDNIVFVYSWKSEDVELPRVEDFVLTG